MLCLLCVFFFFSSRRRHTRSLRDWSSDVCSSDLSTTVRTEVADREELGRKVRELQFELEKLKSTIGQDRRRMVALLAALLVVLGGIGAGVWWRLPSVIKHEHEISFDRGKAREQLIGDIKT